MIMRFRKSRKEKETERVEEALAVLPEPWREKNDIFVLPVEVLLQITDKNRVGQIYRTEKVYTDMIEEDVLVNGITGFGEVVLDEAGRVVLRDGHHRLMICERRGIKWMPVIFTFSPRIRMEAMPFVEFLILLGKHYKTLV